MAGIQKLNDTKIKARKKPGRMSDGGGLYLNTAKGGSKQWVFMWTYQLIINGEKKTKRREMGLGGYPTVSLKKARELASAHRETVSNGGDPITQRDANETRTFGQVADLTFEKAKVGWKSDKTEASWRRSLEKNCATLRGADVNSLAVQDVLSVLAPVWEATPVYGRSLRARIEAVFDYAIARGWRAGDNPARLQLLKSVLPDNQKKQKSHSAMDYKELPGFVQELQSHTSMAAKALQFTILNATRTSETLQAQWEEFDLDSAIWNIPAQRMKSGKPHAVPLSDQSLELLSRQHQISKFVFFGHRPRAPLSNMAMAMLMRRMGRSETVHGFRSSFRDWCGDETNFPREVAEAALAHTVGGVEGAYRRKTALEKRRRLMQQWADYCSGIESAEIVKIHA